MEKSEFGVALIVFVLLFITMFVGFMYTNERTETTINVAYNQTIINNCCCNCSTNQSYPNQTVVITASDYDVPIVISDGELIPDSPVPTQTPMSAPEFPFLGGHAKISVSFANMFALARTSVGIP